MEHHTGRLVGPGLLDPFHLEGDCHESSDSSMWEGSMTALFSCSENKNVESRPLYPHAAPIQAWVLVREYSVAVECSCNLRYLS